MTVRLNTGPVVLHVTGMHRLQLLENLKGLRRTGQIGRWNVRAVDGRRRNAFAPSAIPGKQFESRTIPCAARPPRRGVG